MKFGVYNAILHDRSLPEAIEVIAKLGAGEELAKTWLLEAVQIAGRMMRYHAPFNKDGTPSEGKHKDIEMFYRAANLVHQCAVPLLPFQSPKMAAIAIADGTTPQVQGPVRTRLTVNIFEDGRPVDRYVDGESVPLIEGEASEPAQ